MLMLCVLLAELLAPAQPAADADVWTAVVAQLRSVELGQRGELVIIAETLPSQEFYHPPSMRKSALLNSVVQRNSSHGVVRNLQLPPKTRLGATDSMTKPPASRTPREGTSFVDGINWDSFKKDYPFGEVLWLSLPAFSNDGTKAIIYYRATGGVDDSEGAYLILEKKEGRWVVVDVLGSWIT